MVMSMPASPGSPSGQLHPLVGLLWRAFNEQLIVAGGYSLTALCETYVRDFITEGARELIRVNAENFQVDQAEADMRKLAVIMIDEAKAAGLTTMSEGIFITVRGLLCPLWPFC